MTIDNANAVRLHWMRLCLGLPEEGVRSTFPDTKACHERFITVRWEGTVSCARCSSADVGYLELRKLYHCRSCYRQFSLTSGTVAHRSRLDLRMWFICAEDVINAHARGMQERWLTGHDLATRYGISYVAARELKSKLLTELAQPDGGLIGASICVSVTAPPQDFVKSEDALFLWHVDQILALDQYRAGY